MAIIARLAGEGIGPLKSFDFDFSDAAGNPHPGPHVFAGVNGSGKSTVLRTIAWLTELRSLDGFQWQEWEHLIRGYAGTKAMMVICLPGIEPFVTAQTMDTNDGWEERLYQWVITLLATGKVESLKGNCPRRSHKVWPPSEARASQTSSLYGRQPLGCLIIGGQEKSEWKQRLLIAGYGPSRLLKHLPEVNLSVRLKEFREKSLSFEATVQNKAVQSWLLGLFSKKAIARERGNGTSKYSETLERFEDALTRMCGQDVRFDVDIEPSLQPMLMMYHNRLDFSQLPDGVRSTVGWFADFLMRMDAHDWEPKDERACVLLLDEIDAHLHPKWQRSILPTIKQVLPEVQVFATSHSPFVIASCQGARVHVLEISEDGSAHNRPPEDAPIGESILATMKDIFGVDSRFDLVTERQLEEWNQLRRNQEAGRLSPQEKEQLAGLTLALSSRSEELRQIVSPVVSISDSVIASLQSQSGSAHERPEKVKARK